MHCPKDEDGFFRFRAINWASLIDLESVRDFFSKIMEEKEK
jgi:hypothetical protein